jgi:hypothetical protein
MKRTSAPGSVSGLYVDYNAGTSTPGTQVIAEDENLKQEEICNAVELAGFTLSGSDDEQLYKAIIALSHSVGELLFSGIKKTTGITFPAVRIDEADVVVDAHTPQLVTALRAQAAEVNSTSSFTCTVSGSVVTFPSATAADNLIAALVEDSKVHGGDEETQSYASWRTINIAGTDYSIASINAPGRAITVAGTPATGSQTVICYPHRIAGSTTTARIYRTSARALVSQGDSGGKLVAGLRRRDYAQSHTHNPLTNNDPNNTVAGGGYLKGYLYNSGELGGHVTGTPNTDGTNGTTRIGPRNEPRGLAAYLYMWAGMYVA